MFDLQYRPGGRVIKTAVAVGLCMLLCLLLGRQNSFYAAIAAVMCTQQSFLDTWQMGLGRFTGTCIGALAGYLLLLSSPFLQPYYDVGMALISPFVVLVLIWICNLLGKKNASAICCIVYLSIVLNYKSTPDAALAYAVGRVIDTSIGIAVAMGINRLGRGKPEKD